MVDFFYLGLVVDEHLTWSAHVQSVTAKVSQRLGLLWRLRNRLSGLVLRELYTTCIRPVIEHSSVVWSGISSTDSVRLERLNRKAARLISNTKCRSETPHDILLVRAGLQELSHRRHLFLVLFTYLVVHTDLPSRIGEGLSHWLPDSTSQRSSCFAGKNATSSPRPQEHS